MKALVLKGNKHLEIENRNLNLPRKDEYQIKVEYCGVCSSDIPRGFESGAYHYPLVMGHEFSGVVTKVGEKCQKYGVGDRVGVFPLKPCFNCSSCMKQRYAQCIDYDYYGSRCDGGYGDAINVKEWNLIPLPNDVNLRDAALLEPLAVVVHGLRKAGLLSQISEERRVLIIGCGFLSLLAVQVLKLLESKAEIHVCDRNEFKLGSARALEVEVAHLFDDARWKAYIDDAFDSFNVVIEMTGFPANLSRSIALAARHGSILLVGNAMGDLALEKAEISQILRKELNISGSWNSTFKSTDNDDWLESLELIRQGLKPSDLVTNWTSAEAAPAVLAAMARHKARTEVFNHVKSVIKHG